MTRNSVRSIFVTGSGTDVGKTFVSCRLIGELHKRLRLRCIKPVVSGFDAHNVADSDPARLLRAQGIGVDDHSLDETSPWRFRAPLSADMAAEREGRSIDFTELTNFCRPLAGVDLNLIEGVGGVMAPLDSAHTIIDLIAALEADVILVVGSYLGAISHALTAIEAVQQRNLRCLATVISQSEDEPVHTTETAATLRNFLTDCPLVVIPRDQNASAAELAALVEKSL